MLREFPSMALLRKSCASMAPTPIGTTKNFRLTKTPSVIPRNVSAEEFALIRCDQAAGSPETASSRRASIRVTLIRPVRVERTRPSVSREDEEEISLLMAAILRHEGDSPRQRAWRKKSSCRGGASGRSAAAPPQKTQVGKS